MDESTLDHAAIKALASDTRLAIMKALQERRKTVTELARELELNKATVFAHMVKLTAVDVVRKIEDHRKCVYDELTRKGNRDPRQAHTCPGTRTALHSRRVWGPRAARIPPSGS